jgi:hypothetical protein
MNVHPPDVSLSAQFARKLVYIFGLRSEEVGKSC